MSYITKSPWIIHYDGSSCNGCDIEVLACLTPLYDVERFGVINTGNPKHADIFLITGSINEQNVSVVRQIYEQMPEPKAVAAIGICATSGGVFKDCYNTMGGVDTVIPVDVYVPGCAARPEAIIDGVVRALGALDEKKKALEKRAQEAPAQADSAATLDDMGLPDGAPPEPPGEPVLPGDDIEVKYFGAAPDREDGDAKGGEAADGGLGSKPEAVDDGEEMKDAGPADGDLGSKPEATDDGEEMKEAKPADGEGNEPGTAGDGDKEKA